MRHIINLKKIFISTPFSRAAANRLHKFNVPAFKIGSGECNNYPLIEHIAKFKKTCYFEYRHEFFRANKRTGS